MAENVSTGGLMKFRYGKNEKPKISEDLKRDIQDAYGKYYERKAKELRNKRMLWLLAGLVILVALILLGWSLLH
jgi:hypothetical protein